MACSSGKCSEAAGGFGGHRSIGTSWARLEAKDKGGVYEGVLLLQGTAPGSTGVIWDASAS